MRKVIIGIDENGEPYVLSKPKKVEVEFKQPKKITFRKRMRTIRYRILSKLA